MGNIVEAGGFGDTRVPSDDEDDYDPGHIRPSLDPSMVTYRDGVNYVKDQDLGPDWEILSQGGNSQTLSPTLKGSRFKKHQSTTAAQYQHYGTSTVPKTILARYLKANRTNHQELEKIWEAYQNLLTDKALDQLSKDQLFEQAIRQSQLEHELANGNAQFLGAITTNAYSQMAKSNLHRMISIRKLHEEGKMYLNQEELLAIQNGQLRQYLSQFLDFANNQSNNNQEQAHSTQQKASHSQVADTRPMSPMIPLRESDGLNHGIYLGNHRVSNAAAAANNQAKTYHPRGSMVHEEPSNNIPLNDDNDASGIQNLNRFDIVQLEFQDFFDLMRLKIQYQRQSISQNHSLKIEDNSKGTESVEFAAIEAYRKRLAQNRNKKKQQQQQQTQQDNLDSIRMNQNLLSQSQGRSRGINKNISDVPSVMSNASKFGPGGGNVIVETKQQDVSCFLWPIFSKRTQTNFNPNCNIDQTSVVSHIVTSPATDNKPRNGRNLQDSNDISGIKNQNFLDPTFKHNVTIRSNAQQLQSFNTAIKENNNGAAYGINALNQLVDPNTKRRNSFLVQRAQPSFQENMGHHVRPNQSNIWHAKNNELMVNQEYKPVRVESSFVPSIELAQNIPISNNGSEYGKIIQMNHHVRKSNMSPQFAFVGQKRGNGLHRDRSGNVSEKLDDSIRSPSIKSESVSIHEGDDEPQSVSEDQYDHSQPVQPLIMQQYPKVDRPMHYPKIEAPKSVKCDSKRNIKKAFRFERAELDHVENVSLEYDLDVEANGIRADIESHNEKSEKLKVVPGNYKQLMASPMLIVSAKEVMSTSQISSYQMIDVNAEPDEENGNASQERILPFARNAPNYQNQLIVRPFNKHIQGPQHVGGVMQPQYQY